MASDDQSARGTTNTDRAPAERQAPADEPIKGPRLGIIGGARWAWRQLTSMRTALVLLMLLAIATIPGSVWPQRNVDPPAVSQFIENNPDLGAWLDRLWLFDVYTSPWFSAIYLLLVISLIGCIVPRTKQHVKAIRAQPPRTPRNLRRLTAHRSITVEASPDEAAQAVTAVLRRRRRFRIRKPDPKRPHEVAAEGGYLRETGNLVFHISLLGVIIAFAAGHLWGWRGEVIVAEGETFTSTAGFYHTMEPGAFVDTNDFEPWMLTLDAFTAEFDTRPGSNFGSAMRFQADLTVADGPGETSRQEILGVNNPVQMGATSVYLLGNGYAPVVTVRDGDGEIVYSQATPFLAQDDFNYGSTGAIKVGAADPGLGFQGAFLPSLEFDEERGPISTFPDLIDPAMVLTVYEGDVYPGGRPQSVYTLDVSAMEQMTTPDGEPLRMLLRPGETQELPDDAGSISFDGVVRWAGLVMREDPGRTPVLISALVMLGALMAMLFVQRRRVFVRASPVESGSGDGPDHDARHTEIEIGALSKSTDPGLERLLDDIAERIAEILPVVEGTRPALDPGRDAGDSGEFAGADNRAPRSRSTTARPAPTTEDE